MKLISGCGVEVTNHRFDYDSISMKERVMIIIEMRFMVMTLTFVAGFSTKFIS